DGNLSTIALSLKDLVTVKERRERFLQAFASFNELKHLHKELGSSDSHKKHKRHRTKNGNDSGKVVGNSVQSVDINKELGLRHVKFD
ncbi:hypothetical protein D0Y65_004457, partial [Glycine soja]